MRRENFLELWTKCGESYSRNVKITVLCRIVKKKESSSYTNAKERKREKEFETELI